MYCIGRAPGNPLPPIPKHFSYIAHKAESVPGSDDLLGNLKVLAVTNFLNLNLLILV